MNVLKISNTIGNLTDSSFRPLMKSERKYVFAKEATGKIFK
jgi:hypothetical protein